MTRAVQRKVLAAVAAALLGIGCRDSTTARPVADLSAGGVRVTGTGQIQDAASPPSWWDEFNFDVRSDLTGKLVRSEEHTSELQSRLHLVCRLLLEKKKKIYNHDKMLTV